MKKLDLKMLTKLAIVAALYVALTYACAPLSYGGIQFRFSEMLILLVFFKREYSISLILGCALANIGSPYGIIDVVFGTLATAISCGLICISKNLFIASLYPAIFNGIIVGLEIVLIDKLEPFWTNFGIIGGGVFLGEFVVISIAGVLVFMLLRKNNAFMELIGANRNLKEQS